MIKVFPILLIVILACNQHKAGRVPVSNRDTIMNSYFSIVDSLQFWDTLDLGFKLLKAYHSNDTAYLTKELSNLRSALTYQDELLDNHICENPFDLKGSGFDEVYRFYYRAAFCDTSINITIGRTTNAISMHVFRFKVNNRDSICNVISQTKKNLSVRDWQTILNGIEYSDFWGLSPENGNGGFDGSNLFVTGYERPVNTFQGRYKKIYRWAAEKSAIGNTFKQLVDLSDAKVKCFHF